MFRRLTEAGRAVIVGLGDGMGELELFDETIRKRLAEPELGLAAPDFDGPDFPPGTYMVADERTGARVAALFHQIRMCVFCWVCQGDTLVYHFEVEFPVLSAGYGPVKSLADRILGIFIEDAAVKRAARIREEFADKVAAKSDRELLEMLVMKVSGYE